jgi:cell division protein FtsB
MKLLSLLLIAFACYLGYDCYYGRNGIEQCEKTEAKLESVNSKLERFERRNQALSDEIADLRQGNRVVEELARTELGMIKKQEVFYRVIDKEESAVEKK